MGPPKNREVICARCGKVINQRRRFALVLETRKKYSTYVEKTPLELYFHEKCVTNISVNIRNLWDLIRVMNKLGAT